MKYTLTLTADSLEEITAFLASRGVPANSVSGVSSPDFDDDEDDTPGDENREHDATGMPWDERIHSSSKGLKDDGTWRRKRGVSDALFAKIESELKAGSGTNVATPMGMPATTAPTPPATMGMPATTQAAPSEPDPAAMFAQMMASASGNTQSQAPVEKPIPTYTFPELMNVIGTAMKEGRIDNTYIAAIISDFNLPGIPSLANTHAGQMPGIVAKLIADGKINA